MTSNRRLNSVGDDSYSPSKWKRFRGQHWLLAGIAAIGLVVLVCCSIPMISGPKLVQQIENASDSAIKVDHGYVGWSACKECHSRRVDEFQSTRHFHALCLPDHVEFPPGFRSG